MLKRTVCILIILLIGWKGFAQPIPVKKTHSVIIDTDCAMDDLRAIGLLLSRPEISIKAIVVSDGSLPPKEGYYKVRSILHEFKRDSIQIGIGAEINSINPPWRSFLRSIKFGNPRDRQDTFPDAAVLLNNILSLSNEKITLVCLGPLTNILHQLKTNAPKIERIIWYNESLNPLKGFNYECDTLSANQVLQSGIRVDMISNLQKEKAVFDTTLFAICRKADTQLSRTLYEIFKEPMVLEKLNQGHFRLCDDLAAVYLTNPELFDINKRKDNFKIRFNKDYDNLSVREALSDMIAGNYVTGKTIVFSEFPQKPEMFSYDVRRIMDSAISRYGLEEWKAIIITDEFHGHLGVFSIVGAKMGIKAREIFGVDQDMLKVTTYAGSTPPYSCLTDGIQVSTGATLGMGTIQLAAEAIPKPSAVFTYKDRSIQITLKAEYLKQVDEDINEGIVKFGLTDDGYWKMVRRNALKYWLSWDRNEIFEIKSIN